MPKLASLLIIVLTSGLLLSCGKPAERAGMFAPAEGKQVAGLRGFNVLQSRQVSFGDAATERSFRRMINLGSNAVIFITFLEQSDSRKPYIRKSYAVTDTQLADGIRHARQLGLQVVVKPQLLVANSWAGAIRMPDRRAWNQWFDQYSQHILNLARLCEREGVQFFVIGTELDQSASVVPWDALIHDVRKVFHGKLTYAAHEPEGVSQFPFWDKLDLVSVTLYPSLGSDPDDKVEMSYRIDRTLDALQKAVIGIRRPVWVIEFGMPSAEGSSVRPWAWHHLNDPHVRVDLQVQKNALEVWLQSLEKPWISGAFIWAWYNNPAAGGAGDVDYTPQNKPSEMVVEHFWKHRRNQLI